MFVNTVFPQISESRIVTLFFFHSLFLKMEAEKKIMSKSEFWDIMQCEKSQINI